MAFFFRPSDRRISFVLFDLIIVNLATLFALWIHALRNYNPFDPSFVLEQLIWFLLLSALWLFAAFLTGLYSGGAVRNLSTTFSVLLRTCGLVIIAYLVIYFSIAQPGSLPRGIVGYQGITSFFLMGIWRAGFVIISQHSAFVRPVVIAGAGWAGTTIAQVIVENLLPHCRIIGFIDDDPAKQGNLISLGSIGVPILGTSLALTRIVQEYHVSQVVLAITHELSSDMIRAILDCQSLGIQITLMPIFYEQITGRVPVQHIGDSWYVALPLDQPGAGGFYYLLKRVVDVLGALVGLILYAPLFLLLALAIRIDSRGPILYSQERVGKGGRIFRLFKLRTMVVGKNGSGLAYTEANDPRMTRVGKFLRRSRLDEFPQLINVLRGDMSAVGPRALSVEDLKRLEKVIPFHAMRNAVRPGMAGWAQVHYGHPASVDEARIRLEYDLYYIKHQSIWLDLSIIAQMIGKMLALKGR